MFYGVSDCTMIFADMKENIFNVFITDNASSPFTMIPLHLNIKTSQELRTRISQLRFYLTENFNKRKFLSNFDGKLFH